MPFAERVYFTKNSLNPGRKEVRRMGIAEQMRNLAQDIIASYDDRISAVETMVDGTHNLLADFRRKNDEMSSQLRETLARGE